MSLKSFNSLNGYSVGANADIDVVDSNGNVTANNLQVANEANLGNIANITISGGISGQIIVTDGTGNLSFSNQTPLLTVASINSSNVLSNSISNISTLSFDSDSGFDVIDVGNGVAKVAMNSTFKYWEVDGNAGLTATGLDTVNFITGNNISIVANANSTPQSLEFSVVPSGSNGQLQFSLNNSLSSSANLYFNANAEVLFVGGGGLEVVGDIYLAGNAAIRGPSNITVTAPTTFESNISFPSVDELNVSGNSNLGSVNNITITGGNNGFYLQTDGTGNLAWVSGGGSGNGETGGANTQVQFNDGGNFGGSSNFTFNKTNSNLTLNGNFTVTNGITRIGAVGNVKITGGNSGQFLSTDGNGNLSFTNISGAINKPSILFTVTTDGNNQQFVDNNLTAFQNNNTYMSLYFNGVLMNTSEYALSGNTLTINRYLHTDDQLVVGSTTQTIAIPGSNTQVIFNNNGNLDGDAAFTFDSANSALSVTGNIVSDNANLGNITASNINVLTGGIISVNSNVAVNGPAFSAYANSSVTQTITSGSQQKVLFQLEEYDTNNNFANSRFTPTVAGYYQLNATVRIDGSVGTGESMIVIWKNGSEYKRGWNSEGTNFANTFWSMGVSTMAYANGVDDYFEVYVQQTSGSDRTVTVAGPALTWFNGSMLRGA